MAAKRVTFLLILLLFAAWISLAKATQASGNIPDSNHKTFPTAGKGVLEGEHAATNNNWEGGRKMVVVAVDMQIMKKKLKDVKTVVGGSSSKFSSYTNSKCGNNLGCEQTVSRHFSDHDDDQSGFVAFNADYHAPRNHPPKNN